MKEVGQYAPDSLVYIIAGCYGQEGSALFRLAHNDHQQLSIQDGDLVIFAADPGPPSTYEPVDSILHYLTVAGAEVLYSESKITCMCLGMVRGRS
jgi:ribonuclease J